MRSILTSLFVLLFCATFFLGAADQWKIKTGGTQIPAGWEPYGYDSFDEDEPILLRQSNSPKWDDKQKWEWNTAGLKIPTGWEPFGYDSNDEFDPVLLRRSNSVNWNSGQKWEIKTSSGNIPLGWEPFG